MEEHALPVDDAQMMHHTEKKKGRRKINIEYIEDKARRHITFSKRKAGIMKKVSAAQQHVPFVIEIAPIRSRGACGRCKWRIALALLVRSGFSAFH
jgi:hypothetical protein